MPTTSSVGSPNFQPGRVRSSLSDGPAVGDEHHLGGVGGRVLEGHDEILLIEGIALKRELGVPSGSFSGSSVS